MLSATNLRQVCDDGLPVPKCCLNFSHDQMAAKDHCRTSVHHFLSAGPPLVRAKPQPGLFKHHVETVLRSMPERTGTRQQICAALEGMPAFIQQLQPVHFAKLRANKSELR